MLGPDLFPLEFIWNQWSNNGNKVSFRIFFPPLISKTEMLQRCECQSCFKRSSHKAVTYFRIIRPAQFAERIGAENTVRNGEEGTLEPFSLCWQMGQNICLRRLNTKIDIKIMLLFLHKTNHMLPLFFFFFFFPPRENIICQSKSRIN